MSRPTTPTCKTARVAVSSNVAGRVVELVVRDNQAVHRGDLLYRLDPAPFEIAVRQAQAQLAARCCRWIR